MVYPDFPRTDLGRSSYPRIGVSVSIPRQPGGLSGYQNVLKSNIRISLLILDENTQSLDDIEARITERFIQYAKKFYNFRYVYPENSRNLVLSEDTTQDVVARAIDLIVPERLELINYSS